MNKDLRDRIYLRHPKKLPSPSRHERNPLESATSQPDKNGSRYPKVASAPLSFYSADWDNLREMD